MAATITGLRLHEIVTSNINGFPVLFSSVFLKGDGE